MTLETASHPQPSSLLMTVLYREISTIHNAKCLQCDLSYMFDWSHTWQLNFNVSKCKLLCITNKKSPLTYSYCLNNTPLGWTSTFKYLGVTMNQKLTWHKHINNVTAKASRILNLLRRNLRHASKEAKARAYLALVQPQLEYAASVWTPHLKSQILKIEKVQTRAARWVVDKWIPQTNSWSKTYDGCLNVLRWLTLQGCRDLLSCCQTYKIIHKLDCLNFDDYYCFNTLPIQFHDLTLQCKLARMNSYRFSFFVNSCFLWNSLLHNIAHSSSVTLFKSSLTAHLFNST